MEALMSQILQNAVRTKLDPDASPIDLSWSSRMSCDRLVIHEDLRRESVITKDTDTPVRMKLTDRFHHATSEPLFGSSDSYSLSDSRSSSVCSDDSIYIKREPVCAVRQPSPHPFSIDALIGHTDVSIRPDTPAVITSVYTEQYMNSPASIQYQHSVSGLSCDSRQDSKVGIMPVSCDITSAFWCHVCNALCVNYKDAKAHQYAHNLQGAKCLLRKSMFAKTGYVSQHMKLDDDKIKCGLCEKVVVNCFFTKHQRLHDGHICAVCNSEFSTNSRLQDHMNVHSGSTPFACTLCDRRFAKRSSLTQHQRYHRDHQSFRCNYCSKYFNSKYARAVHERLHTGENPFKCLVPGCTRAFPQKIQLRLHMNSHR